jgi:hypothetical protein
MHVSMVSMNLFMLLTDRHHWLGVCGDCTLCILRRVRSKVLMVYRAQMVI